MEGPRTRMQIISVDNILAEHGFSTTHLRALVPDQANYKTLLFQPEGNVTADDNGVRNTNSSLAHLQFSAFLRTAMETHADLVITPEYSLPWKVLEDALQAETVPNDGVLWVLGCESITRAELEGLTERLSGKAHFIHEELAEDASRFLNPVVYLFRTGLRSESADSCLIALIQFKVCPFGDNQHFEVNRLQCGTRLYHFGGTNTQLRLITLICSDAFAFTQTHAQQLYDRTLIIHIQLNPNPRQHQFRTYRTHLFEFGGHATELITLNWARDIQADLGDGPKCWKNIAGSGWYLRPDKFDTSDHVLNLNHKLGLYYTWLEPDKCHALFFAYEPSVFLLTATKVDHIGVVASLSRRIGPKMEATYSWNPQSSCWEAAQVIEDGFDGVASNAGGAEHDMRTLSQSNPFLVERVLAICAGIPITSPDWHEVTKLDSCRIDTSEIMRRVTVCHDNHKDAGRFRQSRLLAGGRMARLLTQHALPHSLSDFTGGYRFDWHESSPHTNATSATGRRATIVALDNNHTRNDAEKLRDTLAEYLRRTAASDDECLEARQRMHIWFQDDQGQDVLCDPYHYAKYDQTPTESPFDIGRAF